MHLYNDHASVEVSLLRGEAISCEKISCDFVYLAEPFVENDLIGVLKFDVRTNFKQYTMALIGHFFIFRPVRMRLLCVMNR